MCKTKPHRAWSGAGLPAATEGLYARRGRANSEPRNATYKVMRAIIFQILL